MDLLMKHRYDRVERNSMVELKMKKREYYYSGEIKSGYEPFDSFKLMD